MNTKENQKIWIEKVRENLLLKGRCEGTFKNYNYALKKFFNYYDNETMISEFKESDIIDYLIKEFIEKHKSTKTYNVTVVAIRYYYLINFNRELNKDLLPSCKSGKRLPKIIEKENLINIINNESNYAHKLWLLLGFCSGLRVSEVANLKIENINMSEHKLRIIGKGNKERITILPDVTIKILKLYLKNKKIANGYLFPGNAGRNSIDARTISYYFYHLNRSYNLDENITFHSLRHSFATYFLANGGSLLVLQSMLGHSNLNTTIKYLHLSQNFNNLKGIKYV